MDEQAQQPEAAKAAPWAFGPTRSPYSVPLAPKTYDVVAIDCPWKWKARSDKGYAKSAEAQYATEPMAYAGALPVRRLLRPGGLVVAWATWPLLNRQNAIFEYAWRLKYVTGGAWAKRTINGKFRWGTGFVLRSVCEPFSVLVYGTNERRGPGLRNLVETLSEAALDGVAREHSRKPEEFYSMLEALAPDARRADVFGRQQRKGWDVWGDEVGKFQQEAAP